MTNFISVKNLDVRLREDDAIILEDVSFSMEESQTLGLVGESGCGKSVTGLSMMGLLSSALTIKSGSFEYNGQEVLLQDDQKMRNYRKKQFSMIFQNPMDCLNPLMKIGKQISEVQPGATREEIYRVIESVHLEPAGKIYQKYPHQLSGGMRQRVMIAMALIKKPTLLIADEPTTALDVRTEKEIMDLLAEIKQYSKTGILFISHDLPLLKEHADRMVLMYGGEIVENSPTKDLFEYPLHPYADGLLKSVITPEDKGKKIPLLKGTIEPLKQRDHNCCIFAKRCPYAKDICFKEKPPLEQVKKRQVRCFFKGIHHEHS